MALGAGKITCLFLNLSVAVTIACNTFSKERLVYYREVRLGSNPYIIS